MNSRAQKQINILLKTAGFMFLGILVLKYLPMYFFGAHILFDASLHLTTAIFALYIAWFFIDQNPRWHLPFFIFSAVVLSVIAHQRIEANAHNDIGLLLGVAVSAVSIYLGNYKKFHKKLRF